MTFTKEEQSILDDKLNRLIVTQGVKHQLQFIEVIKDKNKNAHALYKRPNDGSYIVWSSFHTGELATTYDGFHHGKYDMDIFTGVEQLQKRVKLNP